MLYLNPAQPHHAKKWLALVQQDRAWLEHWMPYLKTIQTEAEARAYVEKNARLGFYLGEQIYEIWQEDLLVGLIMLHSGRLTAQSVEIGYWLGKAHTGQNLAAAACQLIFSKVFATTPIQYIYIKCATQNYASQSVAKKLGLSLKESWGAIHTYTLSRAQWMQTNYDEDDLFYFLDEIN